MLGLLINEMEKKELEYVLKREMEEILFDLSDPRIDFIIKDTMKERYQVLFNLFRRVASEQDCFKYMPKESTTKTKAKLDVSK